MTSKGNNEDCFSDSTTSTNIDIEIDNSIMTEKK